MTFKANPTFEKDTAGADFVRDKLQGLVEDGAAAYRDSVPRDTEDLANSIFGEVALTPDGYRGRVGATDFKAGLVEFGGSTRAPDGSLRRAIEGLGLDFDEKRGEGA